MSGFNPSDGDDQILECQNRTNIFYNTHPPSDPLPPGAGVDGGDGDGPVLQPPDGLSDDLCPGPGPSPMDGVTQRFATEEEAGAFVLYGLTGARFRVAKRMLKRAFEEANASDEPEEWIDYDNLSLSDLGEEDYEKEEGGIGALKLTNEGQPWFTDKLSIMRRQKTREYTKRGKSAKYLKLDKEYKTEMRKAKKAYLDKLEKAKPPEEEGEVSKSSEEETDNLESHEVLESSAVKRVKLESSQQETIGDSSDEVETELTIKSIESVK